MSDKIEKRFLLVENVEMRKVESGDGEETSEQRFVSGTGVVYDTEVEIWPGFSEKIRSGAFDESLKSGDVIKSYFNHDASQVLSTTKSTPKLELKNTDKGLLFDSPIPPTSYGDDLAINLERGNVAGASFSFTVDEDIMVIDEDDNYHREIVKATIYEVGPVTNPAYEETEVGLRDRDAVMEEAKVRIERQKGDERNGVSNLDTYKRKLQILELN